MSCMVSVIIPTYMRNLAFLRRSVDSVINQTYNNIEIVVVDDSPEDYEERALIADYIQSVKFDGSILYIQNEKSVGGSIARNNGIFAAHGEYITFLDDDDEYMPDKIKNQVEFMIENDCDLSFSNMILYNSAGKVVDYRDHKGISDFSNETLLKYHLTKNLSGTPTFMFKTEKLREIGGFTDVKMGQDFYIMLNAIESGLKIGYCNTCDIRVYKHSNGGISQGRNKITGEKNLYNFKKNYFDILSNKEKKYVRFRHYAVMAVAYKRNKRAISMIGSGFAAFFSSPSDCINELTGFLKNVSDERKNDTNFELKNEEIRETVTK